jgi:hypothetical protein
MSEHIDQLSFGFDQKSSILTTSVVLHRWLQAVHRPKEVAREPMDVQQTLHDPFRFDQNEKD